MLRHYEMFIIVHPNVPEEQLPAITDKVADIITRQEGTVVKIEKWGKRRCAYKIKKSIKGYYFIVYFTATAAVLTELERTLRYDEKILRYQTIRIDKTKIDALSKAVEDKNQEEQVSSSPEGEVAAEEADSG